MNVLIQGSSGGIGLALARLLLARPEVERLFATARDPQASAAIGDLRARGGERVHALPLDVTREETIEAAAGEVALRCERLHLLINASGVLHDGAALRPEKRLEALSPEPLARSFAVNATGPLLVARHFFPLLRHDQPAVLASLSARVGSIGDNRIGGWYGYRASKAALNMLTKTLAIECARRAPSLVCVAIHPGTVDTGLSKPFQRGIDASKIQTPEAAAAHIMEVVDGLGPTDSGRFFAWDGQPIDW